MRVGMMGKTIVAGCDDVVATSGFGFCALGAAFETVVVTVRVDLTVLVSAVGSIATGFAGAESVVLMFACGELGTVGLGGGCIIVAVEGCDESVGNTVGIDTGAVVAGAALWGEMPHDAIPKTTAAASIKLALSHLVTLGRTSSLSSEQTGRRSEHKHHNTQGQEDRLERHS